MARKIDQISLWLFSTLSSFLLMIALTDGSILPSMILSFAVILLLKAALDKFAPSKKWISRKGKLQRIDRLLYSWAIMNEQHARKEILSFFPSLADVDYLLLQRMPKGEAFSANELLSFWRSHEAAVSGEIFVLMTCDLAEDARSLRPLLSAPRIVLLEKKDIVRKLLKIFHTLPVEDAPSAKKEQYQSFSGRIALWLQNIRPVRTGVYLCFFLAMYLLSGSMLYMLSGVFYALLLFAHLITRKRLIT